MLESFDRMVGFSNKSTIIENNNKICAESNLKNVQAKNLKESYKVKDNGSGYIYIYDTDNDNIESGVDFDKIDLLDLMSGFDAEILVNDKAPWTKKLSILKAAAGETKAAYRSSGYDNKHNIKFKNVPENILKDWVDKCVKYLKEMYPKLNSQINESVKQLKESLGTANYNKIQKLIKECLKEGMEVEITIPKKRK